MSKTRRKPRIHSATAMRMAIWHQVRPLSCLRRMKMSVNLLQIEMISHKNNVKPVIWNHDFPMTVVISPLNMGTKSNVISTANNTIDLSQKRRFKLRGSLFLLVFLMYVDASDYLVIIQLCIGFSKSFTVFTGLKVSMGTSTKMVIQSAMAPFQRPGNSKAFSSRPSFDLLETKPVLAST